MKVLLLEFHEYHYETIPSFARALRKLGHSVDIVLNKECAQQGVLAYSDGNAFTQKFMGLYEKAVLKTGFGSLLSMGYDAFILNTAEPGGLLKKFLGMRRRFVATIHNGELVRKNPLYSQGIQAERFVPLAMAGFISRRCFGTECQAFYPYYFGDIENEGRSRSAEHVFCVQGSFEFGRRNYISLLKALIEAKKDKIDKFRIEIIGKARLKDLSLFSEYAAEAGVEHYLVQKGGGHSYPRYFSFVGASDFILPLLDSDSSAYLPYFRTKQTSSIALSVGLGVIPVLDPGLADLYGLSTGVVRSVPNLYSGMRQAMELTPGERRKLRAELNEIRKERLMVSESNLQTTLNRL